MYWLSRYGLGRIEYVALIVVIFAFSPVILDSDSDEDTNAVSVGEENTDSTEDADDNTKWPQSKSKSKSYNYDTHGDDWKGTCRTGRRQSPIDLKKSSGDMSWFRCCGKLRKLKFENYHTYFNLQVYLENNGHTVEMDLKGGGPRAYISGGLLEGKYTADSIHFHWGSSYSKGSEHTINGERYDAEMHFVHVNPNGEYAVLAVLLSASSDLLKPFWGNNRINEIFKELPKVINYKSKTRLTGRTTYKELLSVASTDEFYSYKGSLTTPDCTETVTWIVFTEIVHISKKLMSHLWNLKDSRKLPMVKNYRRLQRINGRKVYFRSGW